jgi:ABC-type branched-subunit amino acid transport system substrate-binding protein
MRLLEALESHEHMMVWPWRLAWAEALFGAGAPVERSLAAWEQVGEPTVLVQARQRELVERLAVGRAKELLAAAPTRPAVRWLKSRSVEDRVSGQLPKLIKPEGESLLKVGVLLPLSGRLSSVGTAILDGMRMRLGDRVRLIIRDVGSANTSVIKKMVEELADEKVLAIVGPINFRMARIAAQASGESGIPLLVLSPQPVQGKAVFRAFVSRIAHCIALIRRVKSEGARRFAIIGADSAYGRALSTAFATAVERVGGTLVTAVEYQTGQLDLAKPARRLARRRFDALFVADEPSRAATVLRYVARAGVLSRGGGSIGERNDVRYVQLLGPSEWLGHPIAADDAQYLSGTWMATEWSGIQAPEAQPLVSALKARLSDTATLFHAVGYDVLGVVQQADAKSTLGLRRALQHKEFSGVLGRTRFSRNGDPRRDLRMYRVSGRGYKRIGTARFDK